MRSAGLRSPLLIVLALFVDPVRAAAQESAPPVPHTGPGAANRPTPPFAEPAAPLAAPAAETAVEQSLDPTPITKVRIASDVDGLGAVPPAEWAPPKDASGSFTLVHRPGEPLSRTWVQSQFDRSSGGRVSRASDALALVQLINRAFASAGFVNSGLLVPPQGDRSDGILDLQLIYGRLSEGDGAGPALEVAWANGKPLGLRQHYVRARFPSARGQPLSAADIEHDFRLLNEDPAIRSISAALRPGAQPGSASLNLIVRPADRFDIYAGTANDRSPSVGGEHVFAGGYLRNALLGGDVVTFEGGLTRGVEDAQIGYTAPLTPRDMLTARASFNNAAVIDQPLLPLDISARERSGEIGVTHSLLREPLMPTGDGRWSSSQSLGVGFFFAHRKQRSFLFGEPFSFAPGAVDGRTEYSAARIAVDYVVRNVRRVIAGSVTWTVGLGGTQSDIPSIPNPNDHFFSVLGQLNFAQRLSASGLELRGRVTALYAPEVLYSGERLSIGGSSSVRGYRESLYLVDRGVVGSLELAYPFSLSAKRRSSGPDWGSFSASIFADGAKFGNAVAPKLDKTAIASVGAALAWTPVDALRAEVAYGHALKDVPLPQERNLQDHGVHFRVTFYPLRAF